MRRKYRLRVSHITYQFKLQAKQFSLLTLFLLFTFILQAQSGDDPPPAMDTTSIDEEGETTIETPANNHGPYYFLEKWLPEAAMDSLQLRHLPDTALASIKKDAAFWYADSVFKNTTQRQLEQNPMSQKRGNIIPPSSANTRKEKGVSGQSWFQTLLWIIIIAGFVAFMIMYLANSNVRLFRQKTKVIEEEMEEVGTENIFAINYQKEIDKAAASGNYRFAIRLLFLRLLKDLSERNIIAYKQDKTNFDYLVQLRTTGYYDNFFRLTRNYEYAWYGKFDVSDDAYRTIKKDFENFDTQQRS
ncbi:MAG TPA: hypothetical protein VF487_05935 [Chitinophagaceae bacterium]